MRASEVYNKGQWLKADDLQGRQVTVTIEGYEVQNVAKQGEEVDEKVVLSFVGKDKALVLNATNSASISALYGDEMDEWRGKPITIFPTTTTFGSKMVACIRILPPAVAAQAPVRAARPIASAPQPVASEDNIPF